MLVAGDPDRPLAAALAARFAAAGLEVTGPLGPEAIADGGGQGAEGAVETWVAEAETKRRALRALDLLLAPDAPILACCHAASATALGAGLDHPERLVGFGLVAPAEGRKLVECARGLETSDRAAEAAERLWAAAGLEAVWVGDSPGLVTARVVACLANEASFALMEGTATAAGIDQAMRLGTRYPRGPLAWANEVGVDEVVATLDALAADADPERYRAAPLLRRLAAAGRRRIDVGPEAA